MSSLPALVIYHRTRDGRLRFGIRLSAPLLLAAALLILGGAVHLALRLPEISGLYVLKNRVQAARDIRRAERADLLAVHERLAAIRRTLDPVVGLNAKLASVTSLTEASAEPRAFGAAAFVEGSFGNEERFAGQLTAMARALMEEVVYQEARQRQLTQLLGERAQEFAARPSLWPVRGPINSPFGYRYMSISREFHKGVDIGVPAGTPIRAPADGKVVSAGYESGYGLMVVLEHRHAISTAYAHLKSIEVEPGQEVTRGARIALSGMSGRTTGSHLHYEVRVNGQPVDPINYMLD